MAQKPKKARRRDDDIIATYTGTDWQQGRCQIARCGYEVHAANYSTAREQMAAHREEVHAG